MNFKLTFESWILNFCKLNRAEPSRFYFKLKTRDFIKAFLRLNFRNNYRFLKKIAKDQSCHIWFFQIFIYSVLFGSICDNSNSGEKCQLWNSWKIDPSPSLFKIFLESFWQFSPFCAKFMLPWWWPSFGKIFAIMNFLFK